MRSIIRLAAAALLIWSFAFPATAQFDSVGSLQFPTSTESAEAQNHFLRGVAILHSFGWKQAIEEFQAAQVLDPDFPQFSPPAVARSQNVTYFCISTAGGENFADLNLSKCDF